MPDDFGWVAIATFALGVATVWLGWQTREARIEARNWDDKRVLRSALAEQLDNCRTWVSHDPARGQPSFDWLRESAPRVDALRTMLYELSLPADLVSYLVWLVGTIEEQWTQIDGTLNWPVGPEGTLTVNKDRLPDEWRVMVERLQVAAALVIGEARRRGFGDVAAQHDQSAWVAPLVWEVSGRHLMSVTDAAYRGAPAFPTDPAFAQYAPSARDQAGAQSAERQKDFLLEPIDRVRRTLGRR